MLQDIKEEAKAFIEDFGLREPIAGFFFCWEVFKKFWNHHILSFWFIVLPTFLIAIKMLMSFYVN